MNTSDANSILADQVKDCGLEYVGKVIEGRTLANPFVRGIFENGLSEREICIAKASIALLNMTLRYGQTIVMTVLPAGVQFETRGRRHLFDWLFLLEAWLPVIEQAALSTLMADELWMRYHQEAIERELLNG